MKPPATADVAAHLRDVRQCSDSDLRLLDANDAGAQLSAQDERRLDAQVAAATAEIRATRTALEAGDHGRARHLVGSLRSSHSGRGGIDHATRERIARLQRSGMSRGQIARELNLRRETVSRAIAHPQRLPRCPDCGHKLLTTPCPVCAATRAA